MGDRALIVTYHGIEPGPPPLWIDPALFRAHLDALEDCGARLLTIRALASGLVEGTLPERAVALTFDDGMLSVAQRAAPLLAERGMSATVFCVAGRLGRDNAWPSQPAGTARRPLADARLLGELADAGFEIGAHGVEHHPLNGASARELRQEIVDSKDQLEQLLGASVTSFAYPYGMLPRSDGMALVRSTYSSACGTRPAYARRGDDLFALPRVDIHYLRRPALLGRAAAGSLETYIGLRNRLGRVRRYVQKDYVVAPAG